MDRPDWHLRWPLVLALAGIAIALSVLGAWWAGVLVLGWIAAMYIWFRAGGF